MSILKDLSKAVIEGDAGAVVDLTQKALDSGVAPLEIINNGLVAGMSEVGEMFKTGEMFLPEVIYAGDALYAGVDIVKPLITEGSLSSKGKVVIGTIKGDLHDIGKNLVAMMLEANGYEVINLGSDVDPESYVQAVKEHGATIVGCSAMLTTTMIFMEQVIKLLEAEGLRDKVKVMIGGAPLSPEFAQKIGADSYAADSTTAVENANELIAI